MFYTDAGELGGAEISLGNLLEALSPRVDAAVAGTNAETVDRLASRRPGTRATVLPPIGSVLDLRAIRAHRRAFREARPDILHVNLNTTGASPWAIAAGVTTWGVRVIGVEHLPHPIRRFRRRVVARIISRLLDAHVAVGERAARETASFLSLPNGSVRVIANGVPDPELEVLPRPVSGPIVGSLGRLDRQKGYDVLVGVLPRLPDVTAVLVGDGAERSRLLEAADSAAVGDRLLLMGWSDEARRHLTTFDVFALPSRFEGLPLVLLEAMLARLPIVATRVGSVSEAVVDGSTGLLVPPDDPDALATALASLFEDAGLRAEMGRRGRERALELFTAGVMAERYEALYAQVLA